jgi:hypothetical protein
MVYFNILDLLKLALTYAFFKHTDLKLRFHTLGWYIAPLQGCLRLD